MGEMKNSLTRDTFRIGNVTAAFQKANQPAHGRLFQGEKTD
jgi:hypothetical protein